MGDFSASELVFSLPLAETPSFDDGFEVAPFTAGPDCCIAFSGGGLRFVSAGPAVGSSLALGISTIFKPLAAAWLPGEEGLVPLLLPPVRFASLAVVDDLVR